LQKIFDDFKITGLAFDSRLAKAGDIFFAIKGESSDGNKFINEVINKGIKVIVTDDPQSLNNPDINYNDLSIILVQDARIALSQAAGILYPLLPQYILAATGTNGKSSVVSYCRQLYSLLGEHSCSIGTIGVECSGDINLPILQEIIEQSPSLTTPDPITIRRILDCLNSNNVNYVAFEASSHGLDQQRLSGLKTTAAGFTSFSQDHLDYHPDMDHYLAAKLKLFTDNLLPNGIVVLNSEISRVAYIKDYLQERNIKFVSVGINGDLAIKKTKQSIYGQEIDFIYQGQEYQFSTKIIGSFQASNLLIAAMLVQATGFHFEEIITKLPEVKAVKGRLEKVSDQGSLYHIFIDYAHTPDSLEKTLLELQKIKLAKGLLKVIFGCGGNRDISKRPLMGQIAEQLADQIIITDDNPRNEQASLIRQQIILGITNSDKLIEIADRKTAIISTINNLQEGDILLIAGKGHEKYQIINNQKLPFSDLAIIKEAMHNKNIY
jgi:UDP-N-acetylmuramoyl-L-alanyl-D-glutamate--2,6-diaminopimelate ligase